MGHWASLVSARGIYLWNNCWNLVPMECFMLHSSGNKLLLITTTGKTVFISRRRPELRPVNNHFIQPFSFCNDLRRDLRRRSVGCWPPDAGTEDGWSSASAAASSFGASERSASSSSPWTLRGEQGWGLQSQFHQVPLFYPNARLVLKVMFTFDKCRHSAAAQLLWHLSIMNVIQRI